MKARTNRSVSGVLLAGLLGSVAAVSGGEGRGLSGLKVHEWGTFTTLHWSDGAGLGWYQDTRGGVSELPGFVHGYQVAGKSGSWGAATARMETPVLYFYTEERMKVDVSAVYEGGRITEFYPKQWTELELIPPGEGEGLGVELPVDPKKPDNHYYQARAVPDAAYVKREYPEDEEGEKPADEWEKFVFYRGVGTFDTQFRPSLQTGDVMSLGHYHRDYGMKHVWVFDNDAGVVRWEKVAAFPAYDWEAKRPPVVVNLKEMNGYGTTDEAIAALEASMVSALVEEGLTEDEALAMVATWDEQWYREPGQRVFSIPPQEVIDRVLPLKIDPEPSEVVRVFVHRQEVMSPETLEALELALKPETAPERSRELIAGQEFGRFVYGAMGAVADDVARRTRAAYYLRGLEAIKPVEVEAGEKTAGEVAAALEVGAASRE